MKKGFFFDERGAKSLARGSLALELVYVWWLGWQDVFRDVEVPLEIYALHGSITIALVAWAGGPRAMQYIGPQVAGVARGISAAARRRPAGYEPHEWRDGAVDSGVI